MKAGMKAATVGVGYRIEPARLRPCAGQLDEVAAALLASIIVPLAGPNSANQEFVSARALVAAGDAWEREIGLLGGVLAGTADKLRGTVEQYEHVDRTAAECLREILRGC